MKGSQNFNGYEGVGTWMKRGRVIMRGMVALLLAGVIQQEAMGDYHAVW